LDKQENAFVDVNPVIFIEKGEILLAKRVDNIVEGGKWHLPGGRVKYDETFEMTLKRVTLEKTNLLVELKHPILEENLVGIYDDPKRDPREHIIGLALLCRIIGGTVKPKGKVKELRSVSEKGTEGLEIAFDHRKMVKDAFSINPN